MVKCKNCNGKGYSYEGRCASCDGSGSIDWWKTAEYKQTGRKPKDDTDVQKGYFTISLIVGVVAGGWVFLITLDYLTAAFCGGLALGASFKFMEFFFRHFFKMVIIAFILYIILV